MSHQSIQQNLRNTATEQHDTTKAALRSHHVEECRTREELNHHVGKVLLPALLDGTLHEHHSIAPQVLSPPVTSRVDLKKGQGVRKKKGGPPEVVEKEKEDHAREERMTRIAEDVTATQSLSESLRAAAAAAKDKFELNTHHEQIEDESWRWSKEQMQQETRERRGRGLALSAQDYATNHDRIMQVLDDDYVPPEAAQHEQEDGQGEENSEAHATSRQEAVQKVKTYSEIGVQTVLMSLLIDKKMVDIENLQEEAPHEAAMPKEKETVAPKTFKPSEQETTIYRLTKELKKVQSELASYKVYMSSFLGNANEKSAMHNKNENFVQLLAKAVRKKISLTRCLQHIETRCMELCEHLSVSTRASAAYRWLGRCVADSAQAQQMINYREADVFRATHRMIKTVKPIRGDTLQFLSESYCNSVQVIRSLNPSLTEYFATDSLNGVGPVYLLAEGTVGVVTHEVMPGDMLDNICDQYGVSIADVMSLNPDIKPDMTLDECTVVKVPHPKYILHKVKEGETLESIAGIYNVKSSNIRTDNRLGNTKDPPSAGSSLKIVLRTAIEWHEMSKTIVNMRRDAQVSELIASAKAARIDAKSSEERAHVLMFDLKAIERQHGGILEGLKSIWVSIDKLISLMKTAMNISSCYLPTLTPMMEPEEGATCFVSQRQTVMFQARYAESLDLFTEALKNALHEKEKSKENSKKYNAPQMWDSATAQVSPRRMRVEEGSEAEVTVEHRRATYSPPLSPSHKKQKQEVGTLFSEKRLEDVGHPSESAPEPNESKRSKRLKKGELRLAGRLTMVVMDTQIRHIGLDRQGQTSLLETLLTALRKCSAQNAGWTHVGVAEDILLFTFHGAASAISFVSQAQLELMDIPLSFSATLLSMFPTVVDDNSAPIFKGLRVKISIHQDQFVAEAHYQQKVANVSVVGGSLVNLLCLACVAQGGQALITGDVLEGLPSYVKDTLHIAEWHASGVTAYSVLPLNLQKRSLAFHRSLRAVRAINPSLGISTLLLSSTPHVGSCVPVKNSWKLPLTAVMFDFQACHRLREACKNELQDVKTQMLAITRELLSTLDAGYVFTKAEATEVVTIVFEHATTAVEFCLEASMRFSLIAIPAGLRTEEDFTPLYAEASNSEPIMEGPRVRLVAHIGMAASQFNVITQQVLFEGEAVEHCKELLEVATPGIIYLSSDLQHSLGDKFRDRLLEEILPAQRRPLTVRAVHAVAVLPMELSTRFEYFYPPKQLPVMKLPLIEEARTSVMSASTSVSVLHPKLAWKLSEIPSEGPVTVAVLRFDMHQYPTSVDVIQPYHDALNRCMEEYSAIAIEVRGDVTVVAFLEKYPACPRALQFCFEVQQRCAGTNADRMPIVACGIAPKRSDATVLCALGSGGGLVVDSSVESFQPPSEIADSVFYCDWVQDMIVLDLQTEERPVTTISYLVHHQFAACMDAILSSRCRGGGSNEWAETLSSLPHKGLFYKPNQNVPESHDDVTDDDVSKPVEDGTKRVTFCYVSVEGAAAMSAASPEEWSKVLVDLLDISTSYATQAVRPPVLRHRVLVCLFSESSHALDFVFQLQDYFAALDIPEPFMKLKQTQKVIDDLDGTAIFSGYRLRAGMHLVSVVDEKERIDTVANTLPLPDHFSDVPGGLIMLSEDICKLVSERINESCAIEPKPFHSCFYVVPQLYKKRIRLTAKEERPDSPGYVPIRQYFNPNHSLRNAPFRIQVPTQHSPPASPAGDFTSPRAGKMNRKYVGESQCCCAVLLHGMVLLLHEDNEIMHTTLQSYTDILYGVMKDYEGHELRTNGYLHVFAFPNNDTGFRFAARLHDELLRFPVPFTLQNVVCFREITDHAGNVILKGLQVCIGLHSGEDQPYISTKISETTIQLATCLCTHAQPGSIRASQEVQRSLSNDTAIIVIPMNDETFPSMGENTVKSFYLIPSEFTIRADFFRERIHSDHQRPPAKWLLNLNNTKEFDIRRETLKLTPEDHSEPRTNSRKEQFDLKQDFDTDKPPLGLGEWFSTNEWFVSNSTMTWCVVSEIDGTQRLSMDFPQDFPRVVQRHNAIMRDILHQYSGTEISCFQGSIFAVFTKPANAVQYCLNAQRAMMDLVLPPSMRKTDITKEIRYKDGPVMFRGLRLRMGIERGTADCLWLGKSMRWDFSGLTVQSAYSLCQRSYGGAILITENTRSVGLEFLPTIACVVVNTLPQLRKSVMDDETGVPKEYFVFPTIYAKRSVLLAVGDQSSSKGRKNSFKEPEEQPLSPLGKKTDYSFRKEMFSPEDEACVVLTEIEGAPTLYALDENAMIAAVNAHNRLLRMLLIKHHGTEAVAVGDAFLIVFKSSRDAMKFCLKAQRYLLEMQVDEKLKVFLSASTIFGERGEKLFEGLRVRMTVHYGKVKVGTDEVTNRYRFSGQAVATCFKMSTSTHGGCVNVSQAFMKQCFEIVSRQAMVDVTDSTSDDGLACINVAPLSLGGRLAWFRKNGGNTSVSHLTSLITLTEEESPGLPKFENGLWLTCVFTDVEGSAELWKSDEMMKTMHEHNSLLRGCLERYRGYEVKTAGHAFFIVFREPLEAIYFAIEAQKLIMGLELPPALCNHHTEDLYDPSRRIVLRGLRLKVGIHHGRTRCNEDTITKRWDFYGSTVTLASKVCASAKGGATKITQVAYEMVEDIVAGEKEDCFTVTTMVKEEFQEITSELVLCCNIFSRALKGRVHALQLNAAMNSQPLSSDTKTFAPVTDLVAVSGDIEGAKELWETEGKEMGAIVSEYQNIIRKNIGILNGVEVSLNGTQYQSVFVNPADAVQFAAKVQSDLAELKLPQYLAENKHVCAINDEETGEKVLEGLRPAIAIHKGEVYCERDEITNKWLFTGGTLHVANELQSVIPGGGIGISPQFQGSELCKDAIDRVCGSDRVDMSSQGVAVIAPRTHKNRTKHFAKVVSIVAKALDGRPAPRSALVEEEELVRDSNSIDELCPLGNCPTCGQTRRTATYLELFQQRGTSTATLDQALHARFIDDLPVPQRGKMLNPLRQHFDARSIRGGSGHTISPKGNKHNVLPRSKAPGSGDVSKGRGWHPEGESPRDPSFIDDLQAPQKHKFLPRSKAPGSGDVSKGRGPYYEGESPRDPTEKYLPTTRDDPFWKNMEQKVTRTVIDLEGSSFESAKPSEIKGLRSHLKTKKSNYKMFPEK